MEKKPEERFASAQAMRAALEDTLLAPARRRARARRIATSLVTGACMLAAAGTSAAWARAHATAIAPAPIVLAAAAGPAPTATAPSPSPSPSPSPAPALASAPALPTPILPLREARSAARAHPGDPRALEGWTRSALHAGDLREARRAAGAWALHDGTVEPRLAMADILDASGRRSDARAVLQEWLETHPDSVDARTALARLSGEGAGTREIARR
jgi:hypothetical protein